ncbi:hypothetical protein WJX73_005413 [Symbiochloris irregularis]|uniref:Uncharacterized protein n=1 Tax=Symbiochloris irregularis TaxID=706552 RepID=A0AAW1NZ51_9CHLO
MSRRGAGGKGGGGAPLLRVSVKGSVGVGGDGCEVFTGAFATVVLGREDNTGGEGGVAGVAEVGLVEKERAE